MQVDRSGRSRRTDFEARAQSREHCEILVIARHRALRKCVALVQREKSHRDPRVRVAERFDRDVADGRTFRASDDRRFLARARGAGREREARQHETDRYGNEIFHDHLTAGIDEKFRAAARNDRYGRSARRCVPCLWADRVCGRGTLA